MLPASYFDVLTKTKKEISSLYFVFAYIWQKLIIYRFFFFFSKESYVWKMYQERSWEFFPVGDCFRKQYEDQLG